MMGHYELMMETHAKSQLDVDVLIAGGGVAGAAAAAALSPLGLKILIVEPNSFTHRVLMLLSIWDFSMKTRVSGLRLVASPFSPLTPITNTKTS